MIAAKKYIEVIGAESSAGINIEYDDDYLKLINMLQEKPEQQFGDLIIEAQGPDWEKIHDLSGQILLTKSKDLNVMSFFTQSGIICHGLPDLSQGLELIYKNLQTFWQEMYPKLHDDDGDFDPDYRANALSIFNSQDGIIKVIRNSFLIKNSLSQVNFNVKEIENILDNPNISHELYAGGTERLNIDLKIALDQSNSAITAVVNSLEYIYNIKNLFSEKLDDYEIKFDHLEKLLSKIKDLIEVGVATPPLAEQNKVVENVTKSEEIKFVNQQVGWENYQIASRHDIDMLLEKIYMYFERYEPSHPAPLFIRRIQRLMNYNFYEIMKDISPDSLDRLEMLVGQPFENNIDN